MPSRLVPALEHSYVKRRSACSNGCVDGHLIDTYEASSAISNLTPHAASKQCTNHSGLVSALQVEKADSATEEMQSARDEAARSISDSMLQQDAAMKQAQEAREASQQAHQQLQKAQHAQLAAEQQR